MQTNTGHEKMHKTKASKALQDAMNTSYAVKGSKFIKGRAKHTWTRSDNKRTLQEV